MNASNVTSNILNKLVTCLGPDVFVVKVRHGYSDIRFDRNRFFRISDFSILKLNFVRVYYKFLSWVRVRFSRIRMDSVLMYRNMKITK